MIKLGLRGWKFWKKEKPDIPPPQSEEDISNIRNLHEKLAAIKLGNAFGLSTREGIKIFKLIEIRPHPNKKE